MSMNELATATSKTWQLGVPPSLEVQQRWSAWATLSSAMYASVAKAKAQPTMYLRTSNAHVPSVGYPVGARVLGRGRGAAAKPVGAVWWARGASGGLYLSIIGTW